MVCNPYTSLQGVHYFVGIFGRQTDGRIIMWWLTVRWDVDGDGDGEWWMMVEWWWGGGGCLV